MAQFNLIDESWIPCTMLDDTRMTLGLHEVLAKAQYVGEIGGDSPLVVAALHRLLIAVLHRNLCIADPRAWGATWEGGAFDIEKLDGYFQRWRGRFDLFDEDRPFYQVAGLDLSRGGSSARLLFHQDNNPTLFTHLSASEWPELTPAEAARLLIAFMAFDVGGTKTAARGEPSANTKARAALLNRGAVMLARGDNLFRTLMLNLCRYAPEDGEPWDFDGDADLPAWERDEETRPEERRPDGYMDLLTWQSRRLLLEPETTADGRAVVRNVVIMKGFQAPDNYLHEREPMLAFRSNPRATGNQDPWPPVAFTEERALWRDSLTLLQSVSDQETQPKTLQWLGDLAAEDIIPHSRVIPVDVLGLCSNRAKVLFWRHERLPLPVVYLANDELAECLRAELELTEQLALDLNQIIWVMAKDMLGISEEKPKRAQRDRISNLIYHLRADRAYWSRLEGPFKRLLVDLPHDRNEDGDYGDHQISDWRSALRSAVQAAFRETTRGMEGSPRNLKALAGAEGKLERVTRRRLSIREEERGE